MHAAEGLIARAYWARYDHYHRQGAMHAVRGMVTYNGRALTQAQRQQCDAYAREVLGSGAFAPWLYAYTASQGRFREGWLPDNYFGRWVVPVLAKGLEGAAATKSLSRRILRTPALPDLGYVVDGRMHDLDMRPVGLDEFCDAVADEHDAVMVKHDGSSQGRGVRRLTLAALRTADLASMGDGVVQEWVRPHPFLARAMPDSVATIRITTVREPDGRFASRAAMLKLGRRGEDAIGANRVFSQLVVGDDGELDRVGLDGDWREWLVHPDTGVAIGGQRVPRFREAVALVQGLHASVPHVGIVGWDVTVDDRERVRLLEWNVGHAGIATNEAGGGPCFTGLGWDRLHRGSSAWRIGVTRQ
jgi:hypothetical protein